MIRDLLKTIGLLPLQVYVMVRTWWWLKTNGDDWDSWQEDEDEAA